jgi:hypothetical protein
MEAKKKVNQINSYLTKKKSVALYLILSEQKQCSKMPAIEQYLRQF